MQKERKKSSKWGGGWGYTIFITGKLRENCTALEFAMPVRPSVKSWVKTLQRKLWEINTVKCNTERKLLSNCIGIVVEI